MSIVEEPEPSGYYKRLRVKTSASPEEIDKAYTHTRTKKTRKLKETENDRGVSEQIIWAAIQLDLLDEAYGVLSDPIKRAAYTRTTALEDFASTTIIMLISMKSSASFRLIGIVGPRDCLLCRNLFIHCMLSTAPAA